MGRLHELLPILWKYRSRLAISIGLAAVISSLWMGGFTMVFPIMKVMLEGADLKQYVDLEIERAADVVAQEQQRLPVLTRQLEEIRRHDGETGPVYLHALRERARSQEQLSTMGSRQLHWTRIKTWLMPWVPSGRFQSLVFLMAVTFIAVIIKGGCEAIQEILVGNVIERTMMTLRERVFRHALRLDYQTLSSMGTSQMMSRVTFDLQLITYGLNVLGGRLIVEPLKAIFCISGAFWVNWRLTLLSILCTPIAVLVFAWVGKRLRKSSRSQMETMARLIRCVEETFQALRTVVAYGMQAYHRREFVKTNRNYLRDAIRLNRADAIISPATELFGILAITLVLMPGAYLVLYEKEMIFGIRLTPEKMEISTLALLYSLMMGVLDPVRKLSSIFSRVKKAATASERVFGFLETESLVAEHPAGESLPRHHQSIEFSNVSFRYSSFQGNKSPVVLDQVDLQIPFGQVVALVGSNGSGKSTLVHLMSRLYDPEHGQVLIDGKDIATVSLASLRRQVGVVPQQTHLFEGSIADNIAFGRPSASQQEIAAAAQLAHVSEFANRMPQGLDTRIGPKGSQLSGGQRQRIALARAFLSNPSILILDEATSAIDSESERLIQLALQEFRVGRTVLIVTHSMTPPLLKLVTTIVVMNFGRVAAVGTHDQLLRTSLIYQKLFEAQQTQRAA